MNNTSDEHKVVWRVLIYDGLKKSKNNKLQSKKHLRQNENKTNYSLSRSRSAKS